MTHTGEFPIIRTVGLDGLLVSFSDAMSEPANRASLAFRTAVQTLTLNGLLESSATLASAYFRFNPEILPHSDLHAQLANLLASRDWYDAALPQGRRLWRVPTVYGTDLAPQLEEAASLVGLTPEETIKRLGCSRVRVLTIGFAPGQPYMGPLAPEFDIPRQQSLTPEVPAGALVLAISQLVLYSGAAPTGWRHVGQTAFRCFRPDQEPAFALNPGDELLFEPVSRDQYEAIVEQDDSGNGGAVVEEITQ